jgi:hypothetical protein
MKTKYQIYRKDGVLSMAKDDFTLPSKNFLIPEDFSILAPESSKQNTQIENLKTQEPIDIWYG